MLEGSHSFPASDNMCTEQIVILDGTNNLLKYFFSNSLDNIKTAIFARTGHNINLEKAMWKLNPKLSISVKHLMNYHNVNYSMTLDTSNNIKYIVVNMRVGDNWFITRFIESDSEFIDQELVYILKNCLTYLKSFYSSDNDSDE